MAATDEFEIPQLPYTVEPTLNIPGELVALVAAGLEDPADIAARHGFTGAKWEALQKWEPFVNAVANQRSEFERNGYTFRMKSALKADALADQLFVQAMHHETTLGQKLAALQFFTRAGDLEPKPQPVANAGPGFSITINIPASAPSPQPITIDAEPIAAPLPTPMEDS